METRANHALVGLFTLAVIASAFGFVYWFAGDRGGGKQQARILFNGPVTGLVPGSNVLFNGLKVGEVVRIELVPEDPSRVAARIAIDPALVLRTDTKARMEQTGITGASALLLLGGSPDAPQLAAPAHQPPTIEAEGSGMAGVMSAIQSVASRADSVLGRVDALVRENEKKVSTTLTNVERFSQALGDNSDKVASFIDTTSTAAEKIGSLAAKLETVVAGIDPAKVGTTVDDVAALAADLRAKSAALDTEKLNRTLDNVALFTDSLAKSRGAVEAFATDAAAVAARLNAMAPTIESAVGGIDRVVKAIDGARINAVLANVETFTKVLADNSGVVETALRNAGALVEDVRAVVTALDTVSINKAIANVTAFTDTLAANRQSVETFATNAASLAEKLNAMAPRLESVLAGADDVVRSVDGAKLSAAIGHVETVTRTLAANAGPIDSFVKDASALAGRLNAMAPKLDSAIGGVDALVKSVDTAKVASTVDNVQGFTRTLSDNRGQIDAFVKDAAGLAAKLNAMSVKLDQSFDGFNALLAAVDSSKVGRSVENVEVFTGSLAKNAPKVDAFMSDAGDVARKLNAMADRVDGVLKGAEGMFGNGGGGPGEGLTGAMGDIASAGRAVRDLAEKLDKRSAELLANLNRFSGSGLKEYEALAADGRRTLAQIERTLRNFDRNPSSVVFGKGSSVQEFGGRR